MCWESLNLISGLIFLKIKQSRFDMIYGHVFLYPKSNYKPFEPFFEPNKKQNISFQKFPKQGSSQMKLRSRYTSDAPVI